MLNGLDLFSGIGGLSIALEPWVRPIAYCERDRFAQANLLSRMRSGQLSAAPIWDDVQTLRGDSLGNWIDIIYGGFPCQDISVAGNGKGLEGERSGLVFEVFRLIGECRPRFVFLENVPALAVRGLDRVLLELHALGYDVRWTIVSAAEMGAPHLRERIWILAHANGHALRLESESECRRSGARESGCDGKKEFMANPKSTRCEGHGMSFGGHAEHAEPMLSGGWKTEPDVGRVANGVPAGVDRIRGLGNAVVPQAAREAFKRLMEIK